MAEKHFGLGSTLMAVSLQTNLTLKKVKQDTDDFHRSFLGIYGFICGIIIKTTAAVTLKIRVSCRKSKGLYHAILKISNFWNRHIYDQMLPLLLYSINLS